MAGIISEKSESSFAPSHSFCRCTTLWRGTAIKIKAENTLPNLLPSLAGSSIEGDQYWELA